MLPTVVNGKIEKMEHVKSITYFGNTTHRFDRKSVDLFENSTFSDLNRHFNEKNLASLTYNRYIILVQIRISDPGSKKWLDSATLELTET